MFAAVLSDDAQNALALLGTSGVVKRAYLAGGSALALHYGHRHSEDFDFFTPTPFDPKILEKTLQSMGHFTASFAQGISLIGEFDAVKMSYFQYDYPLIAPTMLFSGVALADPVDIAAMKLSAIMDRGTKRDFVDVYELVRHGISFDTMFSAYDQKYRAFEANMFSLMRALQYFDDAETTNMPDMITPLSWGEVKEFFNREVVRLAKKYFEDPDAY